MLAEFHSRILMLGIECCRIITRAEIVSPQGRVYTSTKSLYMGETDGLILLFCSWSVLTVSEWVVLAWSRMSYLGPAEMASFVFQVCSRMGGARSVQNVIFLFLM